MSALKRKLAFRLYLLASWFDGRTFRALRRAALEAALGRKLPGLFVDPTVRITGIEALTLGSDVSVHYWSYLSANGGLTIGDNVAIGHRCSILTTEHSFDNPSVPIKKQPIRNAPVVIGDDVWIGANVTILAGVTIGPRSVIAAGAVVTKPFPEGNVIIGGVPARVLKTLEPGGASAERIRFS